MTAYTAASRTMAGQLTHRRLPTRMSLIASPPRGVRSATREAPRRAKGSHRGQRKVQEDDLPRDDVKAQVRVNRHDDEACRQRRQEEAEIHQVAPPLKAAARPFPHAFMRSKYVLTPGAPLVFSGTMTAWAPVRC